MGIVVGILMDRLMMMHRFMMLAMMHRMMRLRHRKTGHGKKYYCSQ
jgi:hypothetical protein